MSIDLLFSDSQIDILYANRVKALQLGIFEPNFSPVVCLTAQKLGYHFLISQLVPDDSRAVFCLADYGQQNLRLHVIDCIDLEKKIEARKDKLTQDLLFKGKYSLAVYAKVADKLGKIVTNDENEEAKHLFNKFGSQKKYEDASKNLRRFKFHLVW